jgi:hypothetical protein
MNNFQKIGGISALIEAITYLIGFAMLFTLLAPLAENLPADQHVAFLMANQPIVYLWNLIIYVINGVFLAVLVLALHARLHAGAPYLAQTATAFGLIWAGLVIASGMLILNNLDVIATLYATDPAQATPAWIVLNAVEEGLGGGVELPGGLWVLLVSWAALRTGALPKALNWLGALVGVGGILTMIPGLDAMEAVFGLGMIVWFIWAGIVMLRSQGARAAVDVRASRERAALAQ